MNYQLCENLGSATELFGSMSGTYTPTFVGFAARYGAGQYTGIAGAAGAIADAASQIASMEGASIAVEATCNAIADAAAETPDTINTINEACRQVEAAARSGHFSPEAAAAAVVCSFFRPIVEVGNEIQEAVSELIKQIENSSSETEFYHAELDSYGANPDACTPDFVDTCITDNGGAPESDEHAQGVRECSNPEGPSPEESGGTFDSSAGQDYGDPGLPDEPSRRSVEDSGRSDAPSSPPPSNTNPL